MPSLLVIVCSLRGGAMTQTPQELADMEIELDVQLIASTDLHALDEAVDDHLLIVSMYLGAAGTKYDFFLLGSITGMLASCILLPLLGMNITITGSPPFIIAVII